MNTNTLVSAHELMAPNWFAVCTLPRHEKRAADILAEREIESFCPLYAETRQWKKRAPVTLELPLFPTYLFARIRDNERGRLLSVPGVISIVGNRRQALSIPDAEIDALRGGLHLRSALPEQYIAVGERVRIVAGAMAGVEGVMIRSKNQLRVVISIQVIMRSISVEVNLVDIEPVRSSSDLGLADMKGSSAGEFSGMPRTALPISAERRSI